MSSERERRLATEQAAAALAHELRGPVLAITSAAQLLRYRVGEDPMMETNLGRILREAERLNALASALFEYGHPAPPALAPADPDSVWTEVLRAQRGELESKALVVRHQPASPRATCELDREQLGAAFGHVLANAIDAAPSGSDLTIESISSKGGWSSLLRDAGPGVPPDLLPRAFDLFVSTKPGRSGLGLPLARRIIEDHGGSIGLAGSEVRVELPAKR